MPTENFFKIRADKQSHIINAAFTAFGKQGYKKASLSDIAKDAGITKGMITYYFGSKKNLYLHLLETIQSELAKAIDQHLSTNPSNYIEKIRAVSNMNRDAVKKHSGLIAFVTSLYYETDPEVTEEVSNIAISEYNEMKALLDGVDKSLFKPEINADLACQFIFWALGGFTSELYESKLSEEKIAELFDNFQKSLDEMQKIFYK